MQNPDDIQYDKYTEEYLIQALANLGQRIGIKGDSIAYKSFNFNDILLASTTYDAAKYVGYIEYNKNSNSDSVNAIFGVANKENLNDTIIIDTSKNIDDVHIFETELTFSIPISGIAKYAKNSICINDDNELTLMLAGKKIGYEDNEDNNTVLMYYKFNISTNQLVCCYKLFYGGTADNGDNYYYLLNVNNESTASNSLTNNYKFNIYTFNSSIFVNEYQNNIYKKNFEDLFNFNNYSYGNTNKFSIINKDYANISELLKYYENLDFESNSAISIILNSNKNILYNSLINQNINLKYNTNKNELLSCTDEDQNKLNELTEYYSKEYNDLNVNEELFYINEDINKLYVDIFKYYNEKRYLESKKTLVKNILLKIYERSIDYKTTLGKRLYIPLTYEFHYICNSNNELNIYYSNNIYIAYIDLDNVDLKSFWEINNNLVFDYDELSKLKIYNFEITYNKQYDDLINYISIKDIYTMPYINANNNWNINDSDTSISAIGKDAGNPNIIIIYNKDRVHESDSESNISNKYELLSSISNQENILKSTFEERWFNVNNALFENIYDSEVKCCAWVPTINNLNYEYFKDSIILSISELDCLEYDEYKENYKGTYILTLWHLVDNDGEIQFDYIKSSDSNNALALGSTVNLLNELSDSSIGNLNSQDLILLKAIISNVAQENLNIKLNNWLIIKNKQSEEYTSDNYNNDLNAILEYDDTVKIKNNHILHEHSANRYISDINNISVTNVLYPRYEHKIETVNTSSEINVIKNVLMPVSERSSKITVNGNLITNIEALIEKLEYNKIQSTEIVDEVITKESAVLSKSNNNYFEYIFNSNVPTLDYKEIFNRNFNLLNRLNIISIGENGQLYNAFIGSSPNELNKNILHIGSSKMNINVGDETLINEVDRDKFNTHDTVSIDFDNIILNSKTIEAKSNIKKPYNVNNVKYYTFTSDIITHNNITLLDTIIDNYNSEHVIISLSNSLIAKLKNYETNDYDYYISINQLFENEENLDINLYQNVNIQTKNNSDVLSISYDNNSKTYHFIKINKDNILVENDNLIYSTDTVKVMYYISSSNDNTYNQTKEINIYVSFC